MTSLEFLLSVKVQVTGESLIDPIYGQNGAAVLQWGESNPYWISFLLARLVKLSYIGNDNIGNQNGVIVPYWTTFAQYWRPIWWWNTILGV